MPDKIVNHFVLADGSTAKYSASQLSGVVPVDGVQKYKETINSVNDVVIALRDQTDITWERGNINFSGANESSSVRGRTVGYIPVNAEVSVNAGFYSYRFYDNNETYTGRTDWIDVTTVPQDVTPIPATAKKEKCRIVYKNATDSIINPTLVPQWVIVKTITSPFTEMYADETPVTSWVLGHIDPSGTETTTSTRIREKEYLLFFVNTRITADNDIKYAILTYDKYKKFLKGSGWLTGDGIVETMFKGAVTPTNNEYYYRLAVAYSDDRTITDVSALSSKISLEQTFTIEDTTEVSTNNSEMIEKYVGDFSINTTGLGNLSIRCAKEQSYTDGSAPQIEFFVLEEPITHKFYMSKDLKTKEYMFTFEGDDPQRYSLGVLQNGDVIACLDASAISTQTKDDANRQNPYVFLASEKWQVQHIVDFGISAKPCGWLENCGFKVLADGSAIFCEYTRQTTATAKVWKLSGDPLTASNWVETKSFVVTSTDNNTGFKHCHMVMQDFYTGICYLATGDNNVGAMLYYSNDNGSTWTQLRSPDSTGDADEHGWYAGSEKYCRMLSMTFTKDYIYWASDTAVDVWHYLFKVERDSNGVLDYSTVQDYVHIPKVNTCATYGTAYIPELNAIFLLDRTDENELEMPIRLVTLSDGVLHTIGKFYVVDTHNLAGSTLGFRTRFSEWYPYNGLVRVGYDFKQQASNQNKAFGNVGNKDGTGIRNINNLFLKIYKDGSDYGFHLGTYYI